MSSDTATSAKADHENVIGVALRFIAAETELLAQTCIQLLAQTIETPEQFEAIIERARLADEWIRQFLAERLSNDESPLIQDGDAEHIISLMRAASALTPDLETDIASLRRDFGARLSRLERQLLVFGKGDLYQGIVRIAIAVDMPTLMLNDPGKRAEVFRRVLSPAGWRLIADSDRGAFAMAAGAPDENGLMQQMAQAVEDYYLARGREIWPDYGK